MVLARDVPAGIEVLLLERHGRSKMAPGAFAFPGGRVETHDADADWEPLCGGLTAAAAAAILTDVRPAARALGFWVAALREAFEEAGLLLARKRAGAPHGRPAGRDRPATPPAFRSMLVEHELVLATDRMAYWAHWITPEERPVRYDTRFFVAAAPAGVTAEPDGVEIVAARWLAPADALARHRAGEITLPAVTQRILASVADYPSAGALLEAGATREVRAIRPRIVVDEGRERILYPWDPGWY